MDSFELNKIAAALLSVLVFVLGVNILSGMIFSPPPPAQPYLVLPQPQGQAAPAAAAAAPSEPLPVVLAKADVARGQGAAKKCASCHTFEKGGGNRVGPNLYDIFGGPKAHAQGFGYSAALKERAAKGEQWTAEDLYAFLENPRGAVQGTSMAFAGIRAGQERADIIAYLNSLSDAPKALPKGE